MLVLAASSAAVVPAKADARKVTWKKSGASVYNGCPGAWGDVCTGYAFAELGGSRGTLMGGLKPGTKVRFLFRGRKITARKKDWGSGGNAVGGYPRAIDFPCSTLQRLRVYDCENWTGVVQWRVVR